MYFPTFNHNSRIKEFSELNFEYFSESGPPIKLNSQQDVYHHRCDFQNEYLNPKCMYEQTLLGFDQLGKDINNFRLHYVCNSPRRF